MGWMKVSGMPRGEKEACGDYVIDCRIEGVGVAEEVGVQPELGCLSMHVVVAGSQQQHQVGERARMEEAAREVILAVAFGNTSPAAAASVVLFTWGNMPSSSSSSSPSSSTYSLPPSFSHLHQRSITHHVNSFPNESSMLAAVRLRHPPFLILVHSHKLFSFSIAQIPTGRHEPPRNLTSSSNQALRHLLSCDPHVIITYAKFSSLHAEL
jgi:hypothetical protein